MSKEGKPTISIIAAMANNRVIGINNKLPWNLPADLKRFKQLTIRKPVIMGQRTFESIGKPLLGRTNIILTFNKDYQPEKCIAVHSIKEALEKAKNFKEVMICGGVSIYKQFLPLADKMYLTLIEGDFKGDAYFPEFDWNDWKKVEHLKNESDRENPYKYSFLILERKKNEKRQKSFSCSEKYNF